MQHQVDTYFVCQRGRLKFREIDGATAQLVWYERPDQAGPKGSDYTLVPIAEPALLKAALTAALGVRRVVDKRREIFLADNVRIHLDDVAGLGTFLEFEAVLDERHDDTVGRAQVERLMVAFGITAADLLEGSYGDEEQADVKGGMGAVARPPPQSLAKALSTQRSYGSTKYESTVLQSEDVTVIISRTFVLPYFRHFLLSVCLCLLATHH